MQTGGEHGSIGGAAAVPSAGREGTLYAQQAPDAEYSFERQKRGPQMRTKDLQALLAIVLFYVVIESLGVTCPILFLTGVSCAGCGMSRAWLSLLRLDLAGALRFHPLFWLPVPAAALLLFRRRLPERVFRWGIALVCVLFFCVYLVRLLSPEDAVVVFQPAEGLIGRLVSGILTADRS